MLELEKQCTRCNKVKVLSLFYDKKSGKYNKASVCIQCTKEQNILNKLSKSFMFESDSKICTKCFHEKDLKDFHLNPLGRHGYKSVCIRCTHQQRAERFARDDFVPLKRKWAKEYYIKNRDAVLTRTTKYRKARPDRYKFYWERWENNNLEYVTEKKRLWKESNKCLIASYSANYKARKIQAIPIWAKDQTSKEFISSVYAQAKSLSESTGIKYAVDHIVPLRSEIVCGLHCPDNLRVITFSENSSKSNRYWPDMP